MKTTEQISADCGVDYKLLDRVLNDARFECMTATALETDLSEIIGALYRRIKALEASVSSMAEEQVRLHRLLKALESEKKEWLNLSEYEERLKLADQRAADYEHEKNGLESDVAGLRNELVAVRQVNVRDGKWLDKWGCCKVCDGEIPHGHTNDCDLYKMEMQVKELESDKATLINRLNSRDLTSTDHRALLLAATDMNYTASEWRAFVGRLLSPEPTTAEAVEKLTT